LKPLFPKFPNPGTLKSVLSQRKLDMSSSASACVRLFSGLMHTGANVDDALRISISIRLANRMTDADDDQKHELMELAVVCEIASKWITDI
jgi:hypothetical protein